MKAVSLHVKEAWMVLYIKHWLEVQYKDKDDIIMERNAGVPQGGHRSNFSKPVPTLYL